MVVVYDGEAIVMDNMVNWRHVMMVTRFPRLLETIEKPGIYLGSLNPENSLEFCVKTLNPFEICERHKKYINTDIFFSL